MSRPVSLAIKTGFLLDVGRLALQRFFPLGQLGFEATLSPYPAVYDRHGFHLMLSKASISAEQTQAFDEALARFLASDANASLRQRFDVHP